MIATFANYFRNVPAVFIDGLLYVGIALFGALTASLTTDESAKYIQPETLFWLRTFCGVNSAWMLALKMFRSTAYSDHQRVKTGNTDFLTKKDLP